MTESLKQQAFGSMQWTAASSAYVSVLQVVQIAVLAYFLSPEEIGTMTMLLLTIWLTQAFSDGGMSPAIIHRQDVAQGLLNTIYALNVGFAVVLYFLLNLLSHPLSVVFGQPVLPVYFPVAMLVVIIAAFGTQFRIIMAKHLRFDIIARHEAATASTYFVVSVVLAGLGFGVWSMVTGYVAGATLGSLVLIFYGSRYWKPSRHFAVAGLSGFLHFGKFQVGERVLTFFNSRLDQLLIGALIGPQALGIYTIAHNFVISPTVRINQIISNVMFPVFARIQEEAQTLRNGYLKLVKVVTIINTPVLLGMLLVAPLFIPIFFDPRWHESIYILQILSIYSLIRSTGSPAGSLQLAKGRADLGFKWNLSLLVVTAPCIYIGAQWAGLTGVAWALLLLHVFLLAPYWILMIRPLIGPPGRDYFVAIFQAFFPGLLMALGVLAISNLPVFPYNGLKLGVMILSGIVLFFLFVRYLERPLYIEIRDLIKNRYLSK